MLYSVLLFFQSAPTRAPGIIVAHNASAASLIVTWSHKVTYHPVDLESVMSFVTVNLTNTTELTNLLAYTMYVINISAVSSGGVGPWRSTKARTDDAGTDNH